MLIMASNRRIRDRPGAESMSSWQWWLAFTLLLSVISANASIGAASENDGHPVPALAPVILAGHPAGVVQLPPSAIVRTIDTMERWLVVGLEAGPGADLFLFQSNPKPHLRLVWKKKILGGVSKAIFAKGSVWVATQGMQSRLLQISIGSGAIEHELALPDRILALEKGFPLGAYGLRNFFLVSQDEDGRLSAIAYSRRFWTNEPLMIRLLNTQPASAVVWDSRSPQRVKVFEDFLRDDQSFHFPDSGADGAFGVACLGDSNTFSSDLSDWCSQLVELIPDPRLRIFNYSALGGEILGAYPKDGTLQFASALREPAVDLLIASFGINDLRQGAKTPQEVLEKYRWMAERAKLAGKRFLATTLAPYTGSRTDTPALAEELNQLLREHFDKDSLIEFANEFPEGALNSDGVHLSEHGHELRAIIAQPHIYGTTNCRGGTPCTAPRLCFNKGNNDRIEKISGQSYAVLRGFLPEAACVLPAALKARAKIAADTAADAWTIPFQASLRSNENLRHEECRASVECREVGNCHSFLVYPVVAGGPSFECRPSRHLHCFESAACKNENRCRNWFGECVSPSNDLESAE